jgi:hypothetical protein
MGMKHGLLCGGMVISYKLGLLMKILELKKDEVCGQ